MMFLFIVLAGKKKTKQVGKIPEIGKKIQLTSDDIFFNSEKLTNLKSRLRDF